MDETQTYGWCLKSYSALLLRLYAIARTASVESFQREAMELIGELLSFDGGWWGRATQQGNTHHTHCSYLHRLPADGPQMLNATDPENLVARRTRALPDRVHCFGPEDWSTQASTAALATHMGIRQSLCITHVEPQTGLASFISLTRREAEPVFSDPERQLLEWLAPHLAAALDLCCATHMSRLHRGDNIAILTTDSQGWLHVAEPTVVAMLHREWPDWNGPRLPAALVAQIAAKKASFLGARLRADCLWIGEHVLVTLRPREARDVLTPKECAVAEVFAAGRSYKEVAQMLALSPATVRHHLRAAYLKLGVSDKIALAKALESVIAYENKPAPYDTWVSQLSDANR